MAAPAIAMPPYDWYAAAGGAGGAAGGARLARAEKARPTLLMALLSDAIIPLLRLIIMVLRMYVAPGGAARET